jgi:hypothetical protein
MPSSVIDPESGRVSPDSRCSSVDFPQPVAPTIATNSPQETLNDASCNTSRTPAGDPNDFERAEASKKATSDRAQPRLGQPHQPIERETNDADRHDRQQDVRVHEALVFLPEETADARRTGATWAWQRGSL